MKVLISGGRGFMGSALRELLSLKGIRVDSIDCMGGIANARPSDRLESLNDFECDLTNDLDPHVFDSDYTHIIHLAALLGVKNVIEKPSEVLRSNVEMNINMLRIASAQKSLTQFLYASTSEVYAGYVSQQGALMPTPENVPLVLPDLGEPRTTYMLSKIYGEAMVRQSKLPFTILRPHNIYGPNMGIRHVIPQLLERVLLQDDCFLRVFSPTHTRTFCYVDDAVELVWRLMLDDRAIGRTLNLGNQAPEISMRNLAELVIEVAGSEKQILEAEDTVGSPKRRAPDMSECFSITRYHCKHELREGISRTLEYVKSVCRD